MKKILPLSLLIIFLVFSYTVFSQKSSDKKFKETDSERFFRLGLKGGVNINKINGQSYKSGYNYNYQVGGFFQFNFGRLGLQPEINFAQTTSETGKEAADVYNDLFRGGSQKSAKYNYLKVPLLLNVNVGLSKHVKLQVGPQFSGILKQNVDSLKAGQNIFKTSDFSMLGGVWIQIPVVHFGARYELGLSNVKDIGNKEKWKSQAYNIFVGITL